MHFQYEKLIWIWRFVSGPIILVQNVSTYYKNSCWPTLDDNYFLAMEQLVAI